MAAEVRRAQDHFWALVNNWKQGKNAELRLCSENGRLGMNYFIDLGVWDPPRPTDPPPLTPAEATRAQGVPAPAGSGGVRKELLPGLQKPPVTLLKM